MPFEDVVDIGALTIEVAGKPGYRPLLLAQLLLYYAANVNHCFVLFGPKKVTRTRYLSTTEVLDDPHNEIT